jgi:tetratricopeptide (TPR) repeat protein
MKLAHIPRLLALMSLGALAAHAEILEDVEVRREGLNAVVQVRLATPINFLRATSSRTSDLTQAYYRVRPNLTSPPVYVPGERRVLEIKGLPVITIEDEPVKTGFLQDPNRRLVMALGQAVKFKVRTGKGDRSIELVLEGLGNKVPDDGNTLKAATALNPGQNFVIALLRSSSPKLNMDLPVPQALQQYQVFTARRLVQGKQVHEMDLGYFSTLAEAETALKLLKDRFPQSVIVPLQTQADAAAPESDVLPLKSASALQDNETQARTLLDQGRQQYEQRQFDDALTTLNQALTLPVTAISPDTQELLGQVLAAMGETSRAEAEFTAYLKQYPEGAGAQRVREALAALKPTDLKPSPSLDGIKKPEVVQTVSGSISQYYYGGKQTQSQRAERNVDGTPVPASALTDLNQASLTNDAQKLLSTNMDATWKNRTDEREMKLFVRDQLDYNLMSREVLKAKSRYRNRLSAAYFDYMGLDKTRLRGRFGRQNASWGGESRYDGASGSFSFRPKWKASGAVGSPVDGVADSKRYFAGASMDADALTPNLGASVFVMQRMIDGEVDRRSVGTDVRYFAGNGNVMGSVDYDTIYRRTNRSSLSGTYTTDGNATYNLLSEHTALVQVSLSQALFFSYPALSANGILPKTIKELKTSTGYSTAELRNFVRGNVSYFNHTMASGTWPVTTDGQVGADYHLQSTGAIAPNEAIGLPNGQAATGIVRSLGMQAIGTNLYTARDTNVFGVNTTRGRLGRSVQFNTNHAIGLNEAWQLDPGILWMRSTTLTTAGEVQASTVSWGPTFRASFKPRPTVTLESNLSISRSTTVNHDVSTTTDANTGQSSTAATTTTSTSNQFTYYLGYRYEY